MDEKINWSHAAKQLGFVVTHASLSKSEIKQIKLLVKESYNTLLSYLDYDKNFLTFGLWDKKLYNEYQGLNFDFSKICQVQDIYSQLLIYHLIRPLIQQQFFDKRILDIGCGNGISLKVSTELLQTQYALGIDLLNKTVNNAQHNFYIENNINYIQADAENLPLLNESFDIILNIESSHLYPDIESFFSEVERVLAPGGFFCYTDMYILNKQQTQKLEAFIKTQKNLTIVQKVNVTKMIQNSIYQRVIVNEEGFYNYARSLLGHDQNKLFTELPYLGAIMGLSLLPWWKIWFKNPKLRDTAKFARKNKLFGKKYYFYYLIQKTSLHQ